ncbi:MAG: prephenate dehydrogenase [Candidatus Saccharimonadales bacterium]
MKSIGIIGFGSFGKFLAEQLSAHGEVKVYSASGKQSQWATSLQNVAECDYVIPAVPLEAYEKTLTELKPFLMPTTVIVDVCSVKVEPMQIIANCLPGQPVVATHPLFGPESAKDSLKDHVLVLCPDQSDVDQLQIVEKFAMNLELDVVKMTCTQHDQEMATVHGLTFFIAHALKDMGLHNQKLATPSFKKLLALAELEKHHSQDLFLTIQNGNPYTEAVRQQFVDEATKLNQQIKPKHN